MNPARAQHFQCNNQEEILEKLCKVVLQCETEQDLIFLEFTSELVKAGRWSWMSYFVRNVVIKAQKCFLSNIYKILRSKMYKSCHLALKLNGIKSYLLNSRRCHLQFYLFLFLILVQWGEFSPGLRSEALKFGCGSGGFIWKKSWNFKEQSILENTVGQKQFDFRGRMSDLANNIICTPLQPLLYLHSWSSQLRPVQLWPPGESCQCLETTFHNWRDGGHRAEDRDVTKHLTTPKAAFHNTKYPSCNVSDDESKKP